MHDKNSDGAMSSGDLLSVMRCLGENPTEDEVQNIINEVRESLF